jgi:hypothetical protein
MGLVPELQGQIHVDPIQLTIILDISANIMSSLNTIIAAHHSHQASLGSRSSPLQEEENVHLKSLTS